MNQLESFPVLYNIIKNKIRHPYYARTVELAKDYKAHSTGRGIEDKLRQYNRTQTDEDFKALKEITVFINKSITSNLTYPYYRIPRSPGITTKFSVPDETNDDLFNSFLKTFYREGFERYMHVRIKDLIETDPNTWLIVDFEGTDGTTYPVPYVFESPSKATLMYEYKNQILDYLVNENEIYLIDENGENKEVETYTIYTYEGAIKITEQPDDMNYPKIDNIDNFKIPGNSFTFNIETNSYVVYIPLPYNLSRVPAMPVGYIQDKLTDGNTFLNIYDNCLPWLEKIIKVNSEIDVTMCKHAFPQKIQQVERCRNENCQMQEDGFYYTDWPMRVKCTSCAGTGVMPTHSSGLDVIYIPFPDTGVFTDMANLDNIVKYVVTPTDIPKFQKEMLEYYIEQCKKTQFNSDIFNKTSGSPEKTATESIIEIENIGDTLYPYALKYSEIYSFLLTMISEITKIDIDINCNVSKDFRLFLTKTELLGLLKASKDAGSPESIINSIQDNIALSMLGDSAEFQKYKFAKLVIPFAGKTKEQQALVLSQLSNTDDYYIRFVYGSDVIARLEQENPDFWLLTDEKKLEAFNAKIAEIKVNMPAKVQAYPTFSE
ncbi:MAG: hypothetical protein PHU98_06430 [Mariniphaga sp.]|nr:hypothetical protein [Paludibacter sp.]MDD4226008.1 hypothetical protein [Mariniphaga sp.]